MKEASYENYKFLMIIGAMKCGTTSLYNYLAGHPEIVASRVKEPEFFSSRQMHQLKVKDYLDVWRFPKPEKYLMEASTGYTKFPMESDVPRRIYQYGIQPKFIYIVRNPFEKIRSDYIHMTGKQGSVDEVVSEKRLKTSNYFLQLQLYRQYFSKSDILVLDFGELKTPQILLRRIYKFLNIAEDYMPTDFSASNEAVVLRPRAQQLLKAYYKSRLRHHVPETTRNHIKAIIHRWMSEEKQNFELSVEDKAKIHNALSDDMELFSKEYGISVAQWGFR